MTYFSSLEVSSAQIGFTSLFGMGRGCPYRYNHQSSKYKITKNRTMRQTPPFGGRNFWQNQGGQLHHEVAHLSILRLGKCSVKIWCIIPSHR